MRSFPIVAALVAIFALFSSHEQASAWGKFGHLTVCDLAYRNLTETSREELKKLFQVDEGGIVVKGRGKMDDRFYTSFNYGCLEEDVIPRPHPKDHFINVERNAKIIEKACPGGGDCILSGIERDFEILKDPDQSNEERVSALMAIGHWVGDIHQPLHVSFGDDSGGNSIVVHLDGKCGSSKYYVKELHGVWDNCLLEAGLFERVRKRNDYKKSWSRFTITYRAVETLLANTSLSEEKKLVGLDPWVWANESYEITLDPDVQYCIMVGEYCQYSENMKVRANGGDKRNMELSQDYLKRFERVAEERVRRAGFRLAHLINLALDPSYTEPVQNSMQKL